MDRDRQRRATRRLPFNLCGLAQGKAILSHHQEGIYLIQSDHYYFLFHELTFELRKFATLQNPIEALFQLSTCESVENFPLKKPLSRHFRAKFGLQNRTCLLPDRWSEDIDIPASSLDSYDRNMKAFNENYGLQLERVLVNRAEGKNLYRCNDAYLLKESSTKGNIDRIDHPRHLVDIIEALESLATIQVSSMTKSVPDNLIPHGWRSHCEELFNLNLTMGGWEVVVVLFHEKSHLCLLEFCDWSFDALDKFALWKIEEDEVLYIKHPRGLYNIIPFLKYRDFLKTQQKSLPLKFGNERRSP